VSALLLKKVERPRQLKWYQAGAMLYGDWGTSKAYVLGIAFALSGHASWFFLGLMSILTGLIGICYMIVCRTYPDGGGVYSAVRSRSEIFSVIGALLLIADYVVTASLSAVEAFHYFNFPNPQVWAIAAIFLIGLINWIGPAKGGSIATLIAFCASLVAGILFLFTLPHLPEVELTWPELEFGKNWSSFVGIVLALSGVEAIANMTGIMVKPVEKTSRKAILPVLIEVTLLTFLLGIAMNAIPNLSGHTEDMLRVLGSFYVAPWYGTLISIVFGFLLLSAVNTSITGLVSIQFILARDRELPRIFSKLNHFGMPALSLIVATLIPIIVLLIEPDVVGLAALYAIGVVGAITLNLGSCATNFSISLKGSERALLMFSSLILLLTELTIAYQKHSALIFALTVLLTGLILRAFSKAVAPIHVPVLMPSANVLTVSEAKELGVLYKASTLLAIRDINTTLLHDAALRAKVLGEHSIYLCYIEEFPSMLELPREIEPSPQSLELLARAEKELEQEGITVIPVWQIGSNPGKLIAYAAKELHVNSVMIGTTKRSSLVSLLRGDVLRYLAGSLTKKCRLIISG
jgi:amino acid transporter/nucleotide-binding universal stress UspA family protein